jgi:CBS domain-containing membrane protein
MLGAACMLLSALAYNNLTRIRYPKRPADLAPWLPITVDNQAITAEDLKRARADMEAFIDVTPEDLEQLIHASEMHAKRRSIGEVFSK